LFDFLFDAIGKKDSTIAPGKNNNGNQRIGFAKTLMAQGLCKD